MSLGQFLQENVDVKDLFLAAMVGTAVYSFSDAVVDDLIRPPVRMLLGGTSKKLRKQFWVLREGERGGPYASPQLAEEDGAIVLSYGDVVSKGINLGVMIGLSYWILHSVTKPPAPTLPLNGFKYIW